MVDQQPGVTGRSVNASRLWSRLMAMAEIGALPNGGCCRLALSQNDIDGRQLFLSWCESRGYPAEFDRIGNLFVRRPGRDPSLAPIALGSHLDTQPNGGRFDGILGVLAALEVLETLDDAGMKTLRPIAVVVWTNEEGARFQPAMMGSGVHCGVAPLEEVLDARDATGISVRDEVDGHGYDAGLIPGAHVIGKYVELHIEQGPILEAEGKTIGVVTGGQAIRWYEVVITGEETHSGPVPMAMRCDPVPVLAKAIALAHGIGTGDPRARCTIGQINTTPGSINVVPGNIRLTIDLRHPEEAVLAEMDRRLRDGLTSLGRDHGPGVSVKQLWHSPVVTFDRGMIEAVRASANAREYPSMEMVSGAGHDAFHLSRVLPTTMIFVPCRGGISHNEREYAEPGHVTAGANVLLDVALALAER